MTRLIAISQRVDLHPGRSERRDALDQRWAGFFAACGFAVLPVPNHPDGVDALLDTTSPHGLLLSGGNDLAALGGDAPERDETERRMVAWARRNARPLLGVCRGMQFLCHQGGSPLVRVEGHVGSHALDGDGRVVNSYHNWAAREVPAGYRAVARTADGVLEAMRHEAEAIAAIMWHPERNAPFEPQDIAFIREFFGA